MIKADQTDESRTGGGSPFWPRRQGGRRDRPPSMGAYDYLQKPGRSGGCYRGSLQRARLPGPGSEHAGRAGVALLRPRPCGTVPRTGQRSQYRARALQACIRILPARLRSGTRRRCGETRQPDAASRDANRALQRDRPGAWAASPTSLDEPMVACDAREIVERAVFFAVRQASLRQTGASRRPAGGRRPLRLLQPLPAPAGDPCGHRTATGRKSRMAATSPQPSHSIPAGAVVALESADPPCNDAAAGQLAEVAALVRCRWRDAR